MIYKLVSSWGP